MTKAITSIKTSLPTEYLAAASDQPAEDKNFCSIIALQIALGVDREKAAGAIEAQGRKKGKGAYTKQIMGAIRELGGNPKRLDAKRFIAKFPKHHKNLKNVTTYSFRRFPEAFESIKGKTVIAITTNHCLAVVNGEPKDWTINRMLHVKAIYEIETE